MCRSQCNNVYRPICKLVQFLQACSNFAGKLSHLHNFVCCKSVANTHLHGKTSRQTCSKHRGQFAGKVSASLQQHCGKTHLHKFVCRKLAANTHLHGKSSPQVCSNNCRRRAGNIRRRLIFFSKGVNGVDQQVTSDNIIKLLPLLGQIKATLGENFNGIPFYTDINFQHCNLVLIIKISYIILPYKLFFVLFATSTKETT